MQIFINTVVYTAKSIKNRFKTHLRAILKSHLSFHIFSFNLSIIFQIKNTN